MQQYQMHLQQLEQQIKIIREQLEYAANTNENRYLDMTLSCMQKEIDKQKRILYQLYL